MKNEITIGKQNTRFDWVLFWTVILLLIGYVFLHDLLGGTLFVHNAWDSYTLQAMAWRKGDVWLSQNYDYLEIAVYNGHYFVSFPPFPSVVMFPLTFIFGEKTPNNFIIMTFVILSVVFAYLSIRKMKVGDVGAMFWALFIVIGSNILWMSTMGGVWFLAQALNFLLCIAAVYSYLCNKKTLSLSLAALAVGCRPFSVFLLMAIFLLMLLDCINSRPHLNLWKTLKANIKYLLIPIVILIGYAVYNYIRFQNPFEFGHNYLPEFSQANSEQFGFQYFLDNLKNILMEPVKMHRNGTLDFSIFNGFMFYIANPIFIVWFIYLAVDIAKRKMSLDKIVVAASFLINIVLLLVHKTFGGWQFGARYTVDLIPYVFLYFILRGMKSPNKSELFLGGFAFLFNVYGTLAMTFKYQ